MPISLPTHRLFGDRVDRKRGLDLVALGQVGGRRAERAYMLVQPATATYQIPTNCSRFFEMECNELQGTGSKRGQPCIVA